MKVSIGAFALRFAATAVLFAPAAAQAQGLVCRQVGYVRVCEYVYYALPEPGYYPPPSPTPPPAAEPPVRRSTVNTIRYNADDEERKAQLQATERGGTSHRGPPPGSSLCPPPYRMTAQDGCQR
jgi:hypothetical protein